jgi:MFS family permease
VDRMGRKPLMLMSVIGCCISLIFEAALVASFASPIGPVPNENGLRACIAALYAFQALYGFGIDGAGVVFYAEVFPNHLRAKGVSLAIATTALASLAYLQVTATAFANIGWRFFLVRPLRHDVLCTYVLMSRLGVRRHIWPRYFMDILVHSRDEGCAARGNGSIVW